MITIKDLLKSFKDTSWVEIEGYVGYAISDNGDVWDMSKNKRIVVNNKDRLFVKLLNNKVFIDEVMFKTFKDVEIWKKVIPPLMAYEVSSWGRMRNSVDEKLLKTTIDAKGVTRVSLSVGSRPLGIGTEKMIPGYQLPHMRVIDLMSIMFMDESRMLYKALLKNTNLNLHVNNIKMVELILEKKVIKKGK